MGVFNGTTFWVNNHLIWGKIRILHCPSLGFSISSIADLRKKKFEENFLQEESQMSFMMSI